jgi:eukaryotic-like serine/threonine-protein kinase
MKRCPECRRDFYDDTLLYCLDDGSALLEGPASGSGAGDEPATAILSDREDLAGGQKRPTADAERQTAIIQPPATDGSSGPSKIKSWSIGGTALLLVIGGLGFAAYKFWPKPDRPPHAMSIERLTTNGKSRDAAISPDGKYVVYIVDEGEQQALWARQVATMSDVQIIPPAVVQYSGLVFSPDSNYINFVTRERPDMPLSVFQMPLLGGTQKKLVSNVSGGVSYSPDGKQFAFVRHSTDESSLLIADSAGTDERVVVSLKRPGFFATVGGQIPAWSPDGETVALIFVSFDQNDIKVVEVRLTDGTLNTIGEGWASIRRIAWMSDKSGLLILGSDKLSNIYNQQIWRISYPDGEVRRLTTDTNSYFGMSLTADSGTLASVQFAMLSNIWVVTNGDAGSAVQAKSGGNNRDGMGSLAWTPDDRIIYYSLASGSLDIWIMNEDGSGQKRLTTDSKRNFDASVSPDGRYIVFTSEDVGQTLWRINSDGSDPIQLANGPVVNRATVTTDSRWVIYNSRHSGNWRLWKVSIDGGDAAEMTDYHSRNAHMSPDGKLIACEYREDLSRPWRYAIIPFEGGAPIQIFDLPGKDRFRWSADSRSLIYSDTRGGVGNIWSYPLDGTSPKQLTNFKTEVIYNFDLSADGKRLVLARGTTTSDVVLIKDFR